ncbi:MAG: hypothetical protein BGP20_00480 [Thiobacillus sp. 63-78]|uniref:outer membrane protein transport protein n=1 Tax=Thiobacillus sp. 63-78 TaxID=1895859 RepID=UPI0009660A1C|nr:outer membrane protein transport protein [Thiobacillus sp. 63-78]OJZ09882.1 MAG: hypothetical protein BGP20_00480 [Thiobacillus sp. 63-78]
MKKNQFALRALAAALVLAHAPAALATNGYFMPGYGFRSMGMGGVGIAYGVDSLSIAANPANIVNTGMRADMGMGVMHAKRYAKVGDSAATFDVSPPNCRYYNCNPGFGFDGSSTSNREWFLMPEMGMTMNLTESLHAGMAFVPNGGGSTVYPQNFFNYVGVTPESPGEGKTLGGELTQLLVPITVGYKINQNHAVGVALDLAVQRFRMYGLKSFVDFSANFKKPITADPDHLTDQGYDYSYGAGLKLGWLGNFVDDKLSVGLSYTTRTYMTKFDKYRGLFAEQGDFDIPANYGMGLSFKPRKNLVFALDVSRIEWSSIAALGNRGPASSPASPVPYPGPTQINAINGIPSMAPGGAIYSTGNDQGMGFGWKDQTIYKFGVNWGMNERLQVRAGYNYGKSPILDDQLTFNTLFPVTTDKHYTLGFTYKATDELEITGTYMRAPRASQHSPNLRQNVVGAVDIGMEQQLFALSLGWVLDPGKTNYGDDPMDPISFAGWYFGFGLGADYGRDWSASRFASSLATQGVSATQTRSDNSDLGAKVYGGYQFNKYFAIEGGYAQFNNFTANGTVTASVTAPPQISAYQTEKNNTWALAAIGSLPLTKDFSLFAKLGANNWKKATNTFVHDSNGDFTRTSTLERGVDPYYGVGVSYALLENVLVRGEYERYDLGGSNIDFLSAGLALKF